MILFSLEATASKGINFKFVVMLVMLVMLVMVMVMTRGSTHKRRLLEPLY